MNAELEITSQPKYMLSREKREIGPAACYDRSVCR